MVRTKNTTVHVQPYTSEMSQHDEHYSLCNILHILTFTFVSKFIVMNFMYNYVYVDEIPDPKFIVSIYRVVFSVILVMISYIFYSYRVIYLFISTSHAFYEI